MRVALGILHRATGDGYTLRGTPAMNVVIFGSTGRTGRLLVEQSLAAGHAVTAFARDPNRMPTAHQGLHVVLGDVLDPSSVQRAILGQDAVLSALSTAPQGSPPVLPRGIRHILDGMDASGVRRIVCLSAAGALREDTGFLLGNLVLGVGRRVGRGVFGEHKGMLEQIRQSSVDWIAVRAPLLTSGPRTGRYRVVIDGLPKGGLRISRADVAEFMVNQIAGPEYVRQMPGIAY